MGITICENWTVLSPSLGNAVDGAQNQLVLSVKMSGNHVVLALFKKMMEKELADIYLDGMIKLLSGTKEPLTHCDATRRECLQAATFSNLS